MGLKDPQLSNTTLVFEEAAAILPGVRGNRYLEY